MAKTKAGIAAGCGVRVGVPGSRGFSFECQGFATRQTPDAPLCIRLQVGTQ